MTFSSPKTINADFFDRCCERYDEGWSASRWESREEQLVRFKFIEQSFDFNDCSILDVGCGQGDLSKFLRDRYEISYTGIDASSKMIKCAKKEGSLSDKFIEKDFLNFKKEDHHNSYDFVIANGVFSIPVVDNFVDQYKYVHSNINKMFEMCRIGFFVNFLSNNLSPTHRYDCFFYYDPIKILEMCHGRTHKLKYDHTVYNYEFMISGYV